MVFALDVGTRKVAGLVATKEEENVVVYDIEIMEHEKRAMLDGQVHDVDRVSRTVRSVKEALELRNETRFEKVAIALAGRYLETVMGEARMDVSKGEIDRDTVLNLELMAVMDAIEKLPKDEMFCIGYSVLSYELDGSWMMKLEGHVGKTASVKVIAAFLPVQVVDSMTAVIRSVGLEIEHMTLEPIAAMDIAVPEELRLLNIALVDVGAGTSDIAISRDGTVVAYGMVPKAGDEITEVIAKEYLLDFNEAENLKRSLSEDLGYLDVVDVLDGEKRIRREEVLRLIDPVLDEITSEIAQVIKELNSGVPKAVMVVGGGAKVPGFVEKLRTHLSLPEDRVKLKGVEGLKYVVDKTGRVKGSDMVTPVGIARSALFGKGNVFSKVYVNGVPIKMMGLGGNYTVMQVLLQAGYDISDILGKASGTIVYEVNGKVKAHRTERVVPRITVNGLNATTRTRVHHGDRIEVEFPKIREEKPRIGDVVGYVEVEMDGDILRVYPEVSVNGEVASLERTVEDGDVVEYDTRIPVSKILDELSKSFEIRINGEPVDVKLALKILREGEELERSDHVKVGDKLRALIVKRPRIRDLVWSGISKIRVKFNGEEIEIPVEQVEVLSNGKKLSLEDEIERGMNLNVILRPFKPMVATLLSMVDLDTKRLKRYKILKNGVETHFADTIKDGDEIQFIEEG